MSTAVATTGSSTGSKPYDELLGLLREAAVLDSVRSLLGWDQETEMPPKAAPFRAEQLSMVATLAHKRFTDPRIGDLIGECESDSNLTSDDEAAANLREIRRSYDRATKLPPELVAEITKLDSEGLHVWKEARLQSDFEMFRPILEKQFEINRRKAECYGAPQGGELYDALIEDFEPGMSAKAIDEIFTPLRADLAAIISELRPKAKQIEGTPAAFGASVDLQRKFVKFIAESVGYDFKAGAIAVSTHPFSETIGVHDSRITTRYEEENWPVAVATTLHEAGHSMYEQGLRPEKFGQPLGQYLSLGIHESQSRMWENQVGRSRAFWSWALPKAQAHFDGPIKSFSLDDMVKAVNSIRPSFIRVESDEATYNFHIMLRFDIEKMVMREELKPADIPALWKERIKADLGIDVPDDRHGCLQDIHWAMGSVGYFPTYTLGNLYCAQMWETINEQIPDLDEQTSRGEFTQLLSWLRTNVHTHGRRYTAPKLCERITGRPLSHKPLVAYLDAKLREIYGL